MRVLDAFWPRGAAWSGQVISSPPRPTGGPFMTHLLPGCGVPRVHGTRSPVPPRLPHFATPRSVDRLAAVAAGAHPPRRPPDAWSPGAPAPPGPCYWLVASGTPMGWCGGCLAFGLVRGALRHYCLGGCSALVVCARRSRPVRGAQAGAWCRVFPVSPFLPRVSCAVCGGPPRPCVPYPRSLVRHSMRSVRSAVSVRLPFWFSPCALCVCVRSRSRGVRVPPPSLPWLVWRAHLTQSRCLALVGPFHAVRAPPRVLPRSRVLFGFFFGGGGPGPISPQTWLGAVCSPRGGSARLGHPCAGGWGWDGRGGLCAVPPVCVAGGASGAGGRLASVRPSAFPGQATKGVSLASLQPLRAWPPYRSGSCLLAVYWRGPCGALVCWRGFACPSWFSREQAAGAGGLALLWLPSPAPLSCRGEGRSLHLPPGGPGPAPPWLAGRWGDRGGSRAVAALLPLWGGRPVALCPVRLSSPAHPPQVYAFSRGRGAPSGAGCGLLLAGQPGGGGGRGGL